MDLGYDFHVVNIYISLCKYVIFMRAWENFRNKVLIGLSLHGVIMSDLHIYY